VTALELGFEAALPLPLVLVALTPENAHTTDQTTTTSSQPDRPQTMLLLKERNKEDILTWPYYEFL